MVPAITSPGQPPDKGHTNTGQMPNELRTEAAKCPAHAETGEHPQLIARLILGARSRVSLGQQAPSSHPTAVP